MSLLLLLSPVLINPSSSVQLLVGLSLSVPFSSGIIGVWGRGMIVPLWVIPTRIPAMSPVLWGRWLVVSRGARVAGSWWWVPLIGARCTGSLRAVSPPVGVKSWSLGWPEIRYKG